VGEGLEPSSLIEVYAYGNGTDTSFHGTYFLFDIMLLIDILVSSFGVYLYINRFRLDLFLVCCQWRSKALRGPGSTVS